MTVTPPAGLRERKKAKTRAAIREAAMRLFGEQGFLETTVEQIAEAAEVSPSTFFRYFPTKEDTVLVDDWDPLLVEALRAQPPEVRPVAAIRAAMEDVFSRLTEEDWAAERRRQHFFRTVPELRARYLSQITRTIDLLSDVLAERSGKPFTDMESRVVAGAIIGVALATIPVDDFDGPASFGRLGEALDVLAHSFGG